jgi:hypothetical protein
LPGIDAKVEAQESEGRGVCIEAEAGEGFGERGVMQEAERGCELDFLAGEHGAPG